AASVPLHRPMPGRRLRHRVAREGDPDRGPRVRHPRRRRPLRARSRRGGGARRRRCRDHHAPGPHLRRRQRLPAPGRLRQGGGHDRSPLRRPPGPRARGRLDAGRVRGGWPPIRPARRPRRPPRGIDPPRQAPLRGRSGDLQRGALRRDRSRPRPETGPAPAPPAPRRRRRPTGARGCGPARRRRRPRAHGPRRRHPRPRQHRRRPDRAKATVATRGGRPPLPSPGAGCLRLRSRGDRRRARNGEPARGGLRPARTRRARLPARADRHPGRDRRNAPGAPRAVRHLLRHRRRGSRGRDRADRRPPGGHL
ncbi:MAG: hypothetical protein AVDCRST_MAG19-1405, partial [uncultured Thermomicrobiales bacterium]